MTEPPEKTRVDSSRRRALLIGFGVLVGLAAMVGFLFTGPPAEEAVPVGEAEPAGSTEAAGPAETVAERSDDQPPTTTPVTESEEPSDDTTRPVDSSRQPAPTAGEVPSEGGIEADLQSVLDSLTTGLDDEAVARLVESGDLRVAWVLADLMRFIHPELSGLSDAFTALTGVELGANPWKEATNQLISWDTPALPGFGQWKGQVYTLVDPRWAPFFEDRNSLIDWRYVTWGGVLIDDRPITQTDFPCPRGCIPALNDPPLEPGSESDYYPDDAYVFAVTVDGESVAFPKNMMEVHEMVNITIGGRRLGIPYCTLCGSAQAYFTDEVPAPVGDAPAGAETFELRTSGLLSRSNKMMYEFHTFSAFDTFTGRAVSGPLREAGVQLPQTTVVATLWGEWKAANPNTFIVVEDGGIGHSYPEDPLRGRDDDGPIFPTGDVDGRLPVQEKVLGVVLWQGSDHAVAMAFPVAAVHEVLVGGGSVEHEGVALTRDGGGLRAWDADGVEIPAHEAFWFAWSQFHPHTTLWVP